MYLSDSEKVMLPPACWRAKGVPGFITLLPPEGAPYLLESFSPQSLALRMRNPQSEAKSKTIEYMSPPSGLKYLHLLSPYQMFQPAEELPS